MTNEWKTREEICRIGRRLYERGFVAANDGNISFRLTEGQFLCTPSLVSKGHMKPDDLCVVDLDGRQLSGHRPRTSEILLHLEIYKADPGVQAVVHCHPPHATAFAVAGVEIPTCVLPEVEVFLGPVPTAVYETPGTKAFAETVRPHIGKANTILLKNHGTIAFAESLERACWYTEIIDAYCRILMLARQLGNVDRISVPHVNELLDLKANFGMGIDPRRLEDADLCINTDFGRGYNGQSASACSCKHATEPASRAGANEPAGVRDATEELIQMITDQVMKALR